MGLFDLQHQTVDSLMLEAPMGIVWVESKKMGTEKMERLKPFDPQRLISSTY